MSAIKLDNQQWFFFCQLKIGAHSSRATKYGYWEDTSKDCYVMSLKLGPNNTRLNGMKKTLVFHTGCAPHGILTVWVMHKYFVTEEAVNDLGYRMVGL